MAGPLERSSTGRCSSTDTGQRSSGLNRLRDCPSSPREELIAAWPRLAPDAAISHESALELLDLSDVIPASVHLAVPRARRKLARPRGVTTHTTTRPLNAGDVMTREGGRVTTPERTIVDVAESGLAPEQTVVAIRQAIDRGLTTPARIRTAVRDLGAGCETSSRPACRGRPREGHLGCGLSTGARNAASRHQPQPGHLGGPG